MGYHDRVILYNKLIESIQEVEITVGLLKDDLQSSLRGTDSNFPNKIERLEDKIKIVQLIEDQITELTIELYNFEP